MRPYITYISRILVVLFLSLFIYSVWANGSQVFADMSRGYEIMEQFNEGGAFNTLSFPSVAAPHYQYTVAWWAPGQWVVPWVLSKLLGSSDIQLLQSVIITVSILSSVIGYSRLFKRWQFDKLIINLSLISILTCQAFYANSLMYYGGTTLMLGAFPWFLLLCLKLKQMEGIRSWVGLILLGLAASFIKNAFLIVFLLFCTYALVSEWKWDGKRLLKYASVFGLVLGTVYVFHLSQGATPGSSVDTIGFGDQANSFWRDIFTSIGSPFSMLFRYGLLDGSRIGPDWFTIELGEYMSWIPALGTAIIAYFVYRSFHRFDQEYAKLLPFFILPFLLVFIPFYLLDFSISYEQRHFAPVVFLLFPAILTVVHHSTMKNVFIAGFLFLSSYDLSFFFVQQRKMIVENVIWKGWMLPKEEVKILKTIQAWDRNTKNGLVLIEDDWGCNVSVRRSDKYVLSKQNEHWNVESGMELDHPDWFEKANEVCRYPNVLTVSKTTGQKIDQLLLDSDYIIVLQTAHYILKEWHPTRKDYAQDCAKKGG